jgi:hypothetical protein
MCKNRVEETKKSQSRVKEMKNLVRVEGRRMIIRRKMERKNKER